MSLSKTNYIIWRDCHKNAWLKVHKPDIYFAQELSEFEKQIIETGNEVDLLARELFPAADYQKQFEYDGYLAITDILTKTGGGYNIYEVKATNDIDKKTHLHDLTFQYNILKLAGLDIASANLIHLNPDYVRQGELDISSLFVIENMTEKIKEMSEEVLAEMNLAKGYMESTDEPKGPCDCLYKGRSAHCTTFHYSNPDIPTYGVHDLARIGLSRRKLIELVDGHKFRFEDIPEALELSDTQKNQIRTYLNGQTIISREHIAEELDALTFPLYFLDYETFPAAVPRFDGFSPYNQIVFQYSLHVLETPNGEPKHFDFLYTKSDDPSRGFVASLREHIGPKGSIVVWHKDFECGRNKELAERIPESKKFFDDLAERIFDLEIIFKKQHYVHKDFKGSSSIKKVLPVLVPELSYKDLEIREGGAAAERWNKIVSNDFTKEERREIEEDLREYCKLDTYAMYAIWLSLYKLFTGTGPDIKKALENAQEIFKEKGQIDEFVVTWSNLEQIILPELLRSTAKKIGVGTAFDIAMGSMSVKQMLINYGKFGGDKTLIKKIRAASNERDTILHKKNGLSVIEMFKKAEKATLMTEEIREEILKRLSS